VSFIFTPSDPCCHENNIRDKINRNSNCLYLDNLVEQAADETVEAEGGAILVFRHVQDGGEAGDETVDQCRGAFWVRRQSSQRLKRLCALVCRQLV